MEAAATSICQPDAHVQDVVHYDTTTQPPADVTQKYTKYIEEQSRFIQEEWDYANSVNALGNVIANLMMKNEEDYGTLSK